MRWTLRASLLAAAILGSLLLGGCFFLSLDGLSGGPSAEGGVDAKSPRDAGVDGPDSQADGDATTPEAGARSDASPLSIPCMNGAAPGSTPTALCAAPGQECCAYEPNDKATLSCTAKGGCGDANQTEIRCDRPAQCTGGACWLCQSGGGYLKGTSCAIDTFGCSAKNALATCEVDGGGCEGGKTCEEVVGLVGFPDGWFHACQ